MARPVQVNYLPRAPLIPLACALLLGCGRHPGNAAPSPSADGGHPPPTASAAQPPPAASATAVLLEPASPAPLPASFVGARSEKACKAQTIELAAYQQRGDVGLGGRDNGVAVTWRVRLGGKPQEQVAFASYDLEGKPVAKTRGVGLTLTDVPPRVFASGAQWTVVWFDEKGLAFTRPHVDQLPPPETAHLGAIGPDAVADVALAASAAGVLATTPFGAGKAQIGLFLFAPPDGALNTVTALGVTHHGKQPRRSAVTTQGAAGAGGTLVVWDEGGALVSSHFDAAGKEKDAPCTVAPALPGGTRERVTLAATATGAMAMWIESGHVRTRALDPSGCPTSPIWTVAEGRWASLASLGDTAIVAWAAADGHLLAARLQPSGAPPARGIDAAEGSSGVKDPPSVVTFGAGKVAFGWSEVMGPVVSTKRLLARIVDAACIP